MYQENVVLCGASAYEQKYYFNQDFDSLPESVKQELHIMCVLYTEEIGGILTLEFDDNGSLQFKTEALDADAMYDENNELVHISTGKKFEKAEKSDVSEKNLLLSSAGFVKWIADGLVEPVSGGMIMRDPLIKETVQVKDNGRQGILSQKYDLFFSLNWVRNLASAVVSVYAGKTYLFNQSGVDVTVNPFASSITEKGVANTVTFVENSGYTVAVLNSLLYVLASTEPGTLYFGAIRGRDRTVSPEIMAFNECVAFFPYFQDDGGFACNVFMNGREMTLENFCYYYADDFVYLTRVKSSERFFPN